MSLIRAPIDTHTGSERHIHSARDVSTLALC